MGKNFDAFLLTKFCRFFVWVNPNPSSLLEHLATRPIFTQSLTNRTVTVGSNVSLRISIYKKNTPVPYVVWCKDLPHSFAAKKPAIGAEFYESQDCKVWEDVFNEFGSFVFRVLFCFLVKAIFKTLRI